MEKTMTLADEFAVALWQAMPYDHNTCQPTIQSRHEAEQIVRRVLDKMKVELRKIEE